MRGGFRALKAMDAYHAVKDGVAYPSVLLTAGMTDSRVAPWDPAKMAARLQSATGSRRPVLLRVSFDEGHGLGSTKSQVDAEIRRRLRLRAAADTRLIGPFARSPGMQVELPGMRVERLGYFIVRGR